jgi:predicted outer membrane repeat protein
MIVFMLAAMPLQAAQAAGVLYVKPTASGSGDCSSWVNACILQTALTSAVSGDEIWVAAGTYRPTTGTDRTITFQLKNGVAVYGGFFGTETARTQRNPTDNVTILSGDIGTINDNSDNSYHVVTGSGTNNTAALDGFTIISGNANGSNPNNDGGGMYNDTGNSPTLANLIFTSNTASNNGGGIYNNSGSNLALVNVTFTSNTASNSGGGIYNNTGSNATLTNVTFSKNSATNNGGGIYNYTGSSLTLTNVTFSYNSAQGGGGMVDYVVNNASLTNVTFSDNSAGAGGGMVNENGSATLSNVTFTGNTSNDFGGGMLNYLSYYSGSKVSLTHVTFSNNKALPQGAGGGLYSYNDSSSFGNILTLTYVTFSTNSATWGGGMYNKGESSPTLTNVAFNGNTSIGDGGGMENSTLAASSPTLTNVTFTGNSSGNSGGGMENESYNLAMINVNFSDNSAERDGGGMWTSGHLTMMNVTFKRNKTTWAYGNGGGIYIQDTNNNSTLTDVTFDTNSSTRGGGMYNTGIPVLTNVTFGANTASDIGGGIFNFSGGSPTLINLTINGNTAPIGGGIANYGGSPIIDDSIFWNNNSEIDNDSGTITLTDDIVAGGCPSGGTCTNIINADPILGPLQDNGGFTYTMALGAGSAAIDAGNDATCATTDQRGVTRPQGTHCDIGAFELVQYLISGNAGVGGATLSYSDGTAKTATVDGGGNYSFTVSPNWSGMVTPSKPGYTFSPVYRTYTNVLADQTAQNYTTTAITYTISGNAGVVGVTLRYTDGTSKTATADGSGNYLFSVSYNWSGMVTPSKPCFNFSPTNRSYTNILADQSNQDYTATAFTTCWMIYLPLVMR